MPGSVFLCYILLKDPFTDEDPMLIYENILIGRVKYPRNFDKSTKSIIKHLLTADLSRRYGTLNNGVNDVKNHRWFNIIDWNMLRDKEIPGPYIPLVKGPNDTTNFRQF